MITLYQFPISHYCEKVRWSLDHKKLDYKPVNLLPGLHISRAKKLTQKSSLPILDHDGKIVSGSANIVSYLDSSFPDYPLTPENENLAHTAMEWERFADKEIGDHVRRVCYHSLLDKPKMVIPFFTRGGPWYGPLLMKFMFPKLRDKMRVYMSLNEEAVNESRVCINSALEKVNSHLQGREFLAGDSLTRADVAIASMLAPLCKPEKFGLDWPDAYPDELQEFIDSHADQLAWVRSLYKNYR